MECAYASQWQIPFYLTHASYYEQRRTATSCCLQACGWVNNHLYINIKDIQCMSFMKTGRLNLRLSENRLSKLRLYARGKEKTVTQLIEDWIDRLPSPKVGDSSPTSFPNQADR